MAHKDLLNLWSVVFSAAFFAAPVYAQDCAEQAAVVEIADGVFVRPGKAGRLFVDTTAVANIGFIAGERCVAVIDSGGSAAEGQALRCTIRETVLLPVCYVIISHFHPDHALGSSAFQSGADDGVEFIGHEKLARALTVTGAFYLGRLGEYLGEPLPPEYIVMPTRTVAVGEPLDIDLGGRVLRITAHPPAHTDNDLSVYDAASGTLWLADLLFVGHIPVVDTSAKGWLAVMERLGEQHAALAVPGHGPSSAPWPQAGQAQRRYLRLLREQTRALLDEGGDLEAAQEKIGYSEAPNWQFFDEFHKRNVIEVFTELEWED